jgi:hypothetical protein
VSLGSFLPETTSFLFSSPFGRVPAAPVAMLSPVSVESTSKWYEFLLL